MMRRTRLLPWAAALLVTGCASSGLPLVGGAGGALDEEVRTIMEAPPFDQVHWGVFAARADSVEVEGSSARWDRRLDVFGEANGHKKFVPASNLKIPVTAAALFHLGPDFRYETALYSTAEQDGDYLRGDLVLPARGDPTLGEPFHASGEAALEALADSLIASGIRVVEGALVVDVSAWDSTAVPESWMVGDLREPYGASGGPFAIDAGELLIEAEGGFDPGRPGLLRWAPLGETDFVTGEIDTVEDGEAEELRATFLPESRRIRVRGRLLPGQQDSLRIAIRDPVHQAAAALHRILLDRGLEIHYGLHILWEDGVELGEGCSSGSVPECGRSRRLAGLESPPLSEISGAILGQSQNWMSEQLVRTLGQVVEGEGSRSAGIEVVERYLEEEVGVARSDFLLRDGSGLSSQNLLTPRAVVAVLDHMDANGFGAVYREALATPGEPESTLEERLEELSGRLHAKTGTMSNADALSGYLVRDDGSEILFSVMTNGSGLPTEEVREAVDAVVRGLAASR